MLHINHNWSKDKYWLDCDICLVLTCGLSYYQYLKHQLFDNDIRPYLSSDSFRGVNICWYLTLNIQRLTPYLNLNIETRIFMMSTSIFILSDAFHLYPTWILVEKITINMLIRRYQTVFNSFTSIFGDAVFKIKNVRITNKLATRPLCADHLASL